MHRLHQESLHGFLCIRFIMFFHHHAESSQHRSIDHCIIFSRRLLILVQLDIQQPVLHFYIPMGPFYSQQVLDTDLPPDLIIMICLVLLLASSPFCFRKISFFNHTDSGYASIKGFHLQSFIDKTGIRYQGCLYFFYTTVLFRQLLCAV